MTLLADLRKGTKLWLAGWFNTGEDGSTYIAIKGTKAVEKPTRFAKPAPRDLDDEIPF